MDRTRGGDATTGVQAAEIVREYGPFSDAPHVHGVTFDGTHGIEIMFQRPVVSEQGPVTSG